MLLNHLAMAESHVSKGEQHIARQREIIARLRRNRPGSETHKQALALLDTLERTQRTHLAERNRLRLELDGHP
jgi:hypothetical protein